jgi:hypothetical protein
MIRIGSLFAVVVLALGVLSCDAIDTGTLSDEDLSNAIDVGGTITELLGDTATDLSNDPDPAVQAAGESATAAEREKEKSDDPLAEDKIIDVLETLPLGPDPDAKPEDDPLAPDKIMGVLETLPLGNEQPQTGSNASSGSSGSTSPDEVYEVFTPQTPEVAQATVEKDPRNFSARLNQAVAQVAAGQSPEAAKAAALFLIAKYHSGTDPFPAEMEYLYAYNQALELALRSGPTGSERDRITAELCAQTDLWYETYPFPLEWETSATCP